MYVYRSTSIAYHLDTYRTTANTCVLRILGAVGMHNVLQIHVLHPKINGLAYVGASVEAAGRRQSRLGCGGGEDELQQAVVIRWRRQWTVSGLPLLGRGR